jgi:hypothetical protein
MALMIDRADHGVGASRQGCHDDEHKREFTHIASIAARDRAGHHTRARSRWSRWGPNRLVEAVSARHADGEPQIDRADAISIIDRNFHLSGGIQDARCDVCSDRRLPRVSTHYHLMNLSELSPSSKLIATARVVQIAEHAAHPS